jgi:hypothetical protein
MKNSLLALGLISIALWSCSNAGPAVEEGTVDSANVEAIDSLAADTTEAAVDSTVVESAE